MVLLKNSWLVVCMWHYLQNNIENFLLIAHICFLIPMLSHKKCHVSVSFSNSSCFSSSSLYVWRFWQNLTLSFLDEMVYFRDSMIIISGLSENGGDVIILVLWSLMKQDSHDHIGLLNCQWLSSVSLSIYNSIRLWVSWFSNLSRIRVLVND